MNETVTPERLRSSLSVIIVGCVFSHISFSIGPVNFTWLAYLFMLSGFPDLEKDIPEIGLLRPLAKGLAAWYAARSALGLVGISLNFYAAELIVAVLALYYHFQLLTNLAELARIHAWPHYQRILQLRSARTILITLTAIPTLTPIFNESAVLLYFTAAIQIAITLWIVILLLLLRRHICPAPACGSTP